MLTFTTVIDYVYTPRVDMQIADTARPRGISRQALICDVMRGE